MFNQFTNYFLMFILVSFYIGTVIRFYQYMLNHNDNNIRYNNYKIFAFIWSLILAPTACFYGLMNIIADNSEEQEEKQESLMSGFSTSVSELDND
jgi:hypothetical protein